jgi:CTP synthase
MSRWQAIVDVVLSAEKTVTIGMVGKYIELADAYKSVDEALIHGGIANSVRVKIQKIDSEKLEKMENPEEALKGLDGILVPGGFGSRGIQGMILAAKFARENNIPYFGICLGMHVLVIEYARHVLGYEDANSTEFAPESDYPVVSLLEEQVDVKNYGGTMRLGLSESRLIEGARIRDIYGKEIIKERHRHRYEVNNRFRQELGDAGLVFGGTTTDGELVECSEWANHIWGVGVQFHPEFLSNPLDAHPLFSSFIAAGAKLSAGIK